MKVLFDDIFFTMGNSGIARYWRSVFLEFARLQFEGKLGFELLVLNRSGALVDLPFRMIPFGRRTTKFNFSATDRELLSKVCDSLEIDLFLSSYYTFPVGTPSLAIAYDFIPERMGFATEDVAWLERDLAVVAATGYVTISNSTRSDLCQLNSFISPENVSVAIPGVDHQVFTPKPSSEIRRFLKLHNLLSPYIVIPGSRHSAKNYKNGMHIFESIKQGELRDMNIVVTGGEKLTEWELKVCGQAKVSLTRLSLTDEELALCYAGATAVVYPSLYEGFGLPPLEALAVGTPVVTTSRSSLPESVGELSRYVSGFDTRELARAIYECTAINWVNKISTEGPKWAGRFTWERTALAVQQAILGARGSQSEALSSMLSSFNQTAIRIQG